MKYRVIALFFVLVGTNVQTSVGLAKDDCSMIEVDRLIDKAATSKPPDRFAAMDLFMAVTRRDECTFGDLRIRRMTELLNYEQTDAFAAAALGTLGAQSRSAIPMLEKKLAEPHDLVEGRGGVSYDIYEAALEGIRADISRQQKE